MLYLIVATTTGIITISVGESWRTVHLILKSTHMGPGTLKPSPSFKASNVGGGKWAVYAGMVTTMVKVNGFHTLLCVLKTNPVTP